MCFKLPSVNWVPSVLGLAESGLASRAMEARAEAD